MTAESTALVGARFPLLELLHPRGATRLLVATIVVAALFGVVATSGMGWPLWGAIAAGLVLLLIPASVKWRSDLRLFGPALTVLGALLVLQGFHGIEHLAQFFQNHVLGLNLRASNGLLSPANAEWVHFIWNWAVLLTIVALMVSGNLRNIFGYALLIWTTAHTLEHTYLMVRNLQVLDELRAMGINGITAQGLPGILGQDGWLARSDITQGTFLCRIPGLTVASRLDIHFGWNAGELALLVFAAHRTLRPATPRRWVAPRLGRLPVGGGVR
jgi:hypothetical protein